MSDASEDDGKSSTCPRCGGPPQPPRKPTPMRPFLLPSKKLTCSLCGLEFERGAPPWPRGEEGPRK